MLAGLVLVSLFAVTAAPSHRALGHRPASAASAQLRVRDDAVCKGGRTAWMYARPGTAWMYAQRNRTAWMYAFINRTAWMYAAPAHRGAGPGACLVRGGMPA